MKTAYKGYRIVVEQDPDPLNPRTDCDNATVIWCYHPRYELGDKDNPWTWHTALREFNSNWSDLERAVIKRARPLAIAPLFLYDHSSLHLKIGSFEGMLPQGHARFDTMPVGWVMVTRESYRKCIGEPPKRRTKGVKDRLQLLLEQDTATYDRYLSGQIYEFTVYDENDEVVESCGSIDEYDECLDHARALIDDLLRRKGEQLKFEFASIP